MRPSSHYLRKYRALKEVVEKAGFIAEIGSFGYTDGIGFRSECGGDTSRLFWAGYRERGVILYAPPPEPIYWVGRPERVADLCLTLLEQMKETRNPPRIDQALKAEYGLEVVPSMVWHAEENKERVHRFSEMGWLQLSPQEEDEVFNRFSSSFFLSGGGPNWVREPSGSLTWDTSPAYARCDEAKRLCDNLTLGILRAFRRCMFSGELLYAFEYQGPIMSFDPRADVTCATRDCLPVPILPDGDATFIVARDFRFGLLAPYPIKKICTFGPEFIDALGDDWPPPPIKLLRKN